MDFEKFINQAKAEINKKMKKPEDQPKLSANLMSSDPFQPTAEEQRKEQLRTSFFLIGVLIFLGILAFNFFGKTWIRNISRDTSLSFWTIGLAVIVTLIGLNIVMGVLKGMFNLVTLNSDWRDRATKKPIVKIVFLLLAIQIGFSLLTLSLRFMVEMEINQKINDFFQKGFEFTIDTDEGEKVIKMDDGTLKIQNKNGETKEINIPFTE